MYDDNDEFFMAGVDNGSLKTLSKTCMCAWWGWKIDGNGGFRMKLEWRWMKN